MSIVLEIKSWWVLRVWRKEIIWLWYQRSRADEINLHQAGIWRRLHTGVILFVKQLKKSLNNWAMKLERTLVETNPGTFYPASNVIKGSLNLTVTDQYWISFLQQNYSNASFGKKSSNAKKVMVEYSPNTNKPLHLGHLKKYFSWAGVWHRY